MRYATSLPRLDYVVSKHRSLDGAIEQIEQASRPGYTAEPWRQLCERQSDGSYRVIAEFETATQRWMSYDEAVGFLPRAVG